MGSKRRWLAAAPLVAMLCVGVALVGASGATANDTPSPLIEVQRWLPAANGGMKRVTTIIDTRLADPDAVMAARYPNALTSGEVSAQFAIFGKWAPEDIPVPVRYDDSYDPPGVNGRAHLLWAMGVWNSLPGHSFAFSDGGMTTADTPTCVENEGDYSNTVRFSFLLDPAVLGETCALFAFDGIDGTERILEFDVHMSAGTQWSMATDAPVGEYDLRSVFLHELGHAFGLDHAATGTVMQISLGTGEEVRFPTEDDIAAILSLYGTGEASTSTSTSTPTATATPTPTEMPWLPPITAVPPAEKSYRATFGGLSRD